jgi:hypothetical protein
MFGNSSSARDHTVAVATAPKVDFSWDDDSPKKTVDQDDKNTTICLTIHIFLSPQARSRVLLPPQTRNLRTLPQECSFCRHSMKRSRCFLYSLLLPIVVPRSLVQYLNISRALQCVSSRLFEEGWRTQNGKTQDVDSSAKASVQASCVLQQNDPYA